jgi:nuclear transport factor 2 (NTF2) superfamily protein
LNNPPPAPATGENGMDRPPASALHRRDSSTESAPRRGRLEHARSARVALAYTIDSRWRNRAEFLQGRAGDRGIPHAQVEPRARLPPDQGALGVPRNRIAVRFATSGATTAALVPQLRQRELGVRCARADALRIASINDLPIKASERKYHWPLGPPSGRSSVVE